MKRERLIWRGEVGRRADANGLIRRPCDAVLVTRGRPRLVIMGCPCGCGDELVVNVDASIDGSWRLYRRGGTASLYPSVWRDDRCRSHFVIWNDSVFLFDLDRSGVDAPQDAELEERILAYLDEHGLTHYVSIADALNEVPWAVVSVLRVLERRGVVRGRKDTFERTPVR